MPTVRTPYCVANKQTESVFASLFGACPNCVRACVSIAMAVCIVDVDSEHTPTIQYGNMYVRVDSM